MLRKLIRSYVTEVLAGEMKPSPMIDNIFNSHDHYATVVCIQNGYLLRLSFSKLQLNHMQSSIVYCRDEKEVSDQLSAHAVRAKLNIPITGSAASTIPSSALTGATVTQASARPFP